MNVRWIHLMIWFLAGTFAFTTTAIATFAPKEKANLDKERTQHLIKSQSEVDTLNAGRIRTDQFVYAFYRNGRKVGKAIFTIEEQLDNTYQFTGEILTDRFNQRWTSTATSSLKPISATLMIRQKGDTTFSMKIEYKDDHVNGTIMNANKGPSKVEVHAVSADLPLGTVVDQRIDWMVPQASLLEIGEKLRFAVYSPRPGVSQVIGEVVGKEQIQIPAGTFETYHVIYNIDKPEQKEIYEVWVTQDIPRMMVREKFPGDIGKVELVKIRTNE